MDNQRPTSLYDLMNSVIQDEKLNFEQKKGLIDELRKNNPIASDRWTYRWALWILGVSVLLVLVFIFIIANTGGEVPESLIAIGSTISGGVIGVLSTKQAKTGDNVK